MNLQKVKNLYFDLKKGLIVETEDGKKWYLFLWFDNGQYSWNELKEETE